MRLGKLWLSLCVVVSSGCSFQHHTERAEQQWLRAGSLNGALYSADLTAEVSAAVEGEQSFMAATSAHTYLRGQIESRDIDELSGIAPVIGAGDKYWGINDSGNLPRLFAFNGSGKHLAVFNVALPNRDWEDLASYRFKNTNWLAISESGDNMRRHAVSSIHVFHQPDVQRPPVELKPAYRINFSYEDGPRNVESMAVSVSEGLIYLIAKNRAAANIYTLPIEPRDTASVLVAKKVGRLADLRPTSDDTWWERWFAGRVLATATGFDISLDNRLAVVANYRHVYLFTRKGSEPWAAALARRPKVLTTHRLKQSEAVAFSADAGQVIVSSEGINPPLLAIRPAANRSSTGQL